MITTVYRFVRSIIAPMAVLVAVSSCDDSAPGGPIPPRSGTRVLLTDAPFPFDTVARVDVHIVSVDASETADTSGGSFGWVNIVEPRQVFNLLDLQRGATAIVGEGDLPAGQYQAIRLVINTNVSSITYRDGAEATIRWGVAGELALHALVEEPMTVGNDGADIVIDFDVGRSFAYNVASLPDSMGGTQTSEFAFIPWIRAVNEAATGSIVGTVVGDVDGQGENDPVEFATVNVLRGNSLSSPQAWWTVATGATDAQGSFRIDFLLAGDYIVRATPPRSLELGAVTEAGVEVSVGGETQVVLTFPDAEVASLELIGPQEVEVGQQITLRAVLLDTEGDTLFGEPISWEASPAGLVELSDPSGGALTGDLAHVTGLQGGVVIVRASRFELFAELAIVVRDPNAPPVETVVLSPESQTVDVFDSLTINVTLLDGAGNELSGRHITWAVSDSTILHPVYTENDLVLLAPGRQDFIALKSGTATVTATSEGQSAVATVTVRE